MGALFELAHLTLIAAKPLRIDERQGWSTWLCEHARSHGGAVWRLLDPALIGRPGAGHSHVVHLPAERLAAFDRATTAARDTGEAAFHAEISRDHWSRAGEGIAVRRDVPITGLIVAHVLCADPRRTDEWDDWYDTQHLPDMLASGAFITGTRWRRDAPRTGEANHLTVYEIGGITVDEAIERSAAVMPALTTAGRKHECHTGGLTWALELEG